MMNGSIPFPYTPEIAEQWIAKHQNDDRDSLSIVWAINSKSFAIFFGIIQLRINPELKSARLSYWLGECHRNNGFATEAGRAVLNFGFNKIKIKKIEAEVFKRNVRSKNVLLKLNLSFQGTITKIEKLEQRLEEFEQYYILKEEFEFNYE